jgi:hypothetical protein
MNLQDLTSHQENAVVAAIIALGTLYCFLGYRTLRLIIALTGFVIAGGVAATLANWVAEGHYLLIAIVGFIGGIAGACALTFLYKVGIFLLGSLGGGIAAHAALHARPESWIPFVIVGLATVGGLLGLVIEAPVIMIATSAIGSWLVVSGVSYFLDGTAELGQFGFEPSNGDNSPAMLLAWAMLAFAGAMAQFATRKKE